MTTATAGIPRRRIPAEDRLWARVDKDGPIPQHRPDLGPCWLWTGPVSPGRRGGYGQLRIGSVLEGNYRLIQVHRLSYEIAIGPIPQGLTLDHLCRTRRCVRASHLEPTTNRENILRGESPPAKNARQTECARGHPFDQENTSVRKNGIRVCRTCDRARELRRPPRQKKAGAR